MVKPLAANEGSSSWFIVLGTFADWIVFHKQILDAGPVHDGVDLLHFPDVPVLLDRRER